MNVKCPYCGCSYNIDIDSLPKPIGDLKLGYGWWLRCCKCHKKWWLKNLVAQVYSNSPIKADVAGKIDRLSRFKKKPQAPRSYRWIWTLAKYLLIASVIGVAAIGWHNKEFFTEYIKHKIERLSSSMALKLRMLDVQYSLKSNQQNKNVVAVNGKIINDDKNVIKLTGIKVTVYDQNNKEIASWSDSIGSGYIISGETLDFATEHVVDLDNGNIKVDVSIL